ncbi:DUF6907 domain-containing protein [Streptomyces iconiensis]|uniref:Uncharacterized protein n=1 Tax=Streptomyces iconiensis TaxID=1384038 RepID=A0ABT6ZRU8_9ACTN|nr:hypothetical protein [Streptomyces iconiensis]MDJ1131783.1 hypothetical protein [Streptomyces iconiensis]
MTGHDNSPRPNAGRGPVTVHTRDHGPVTMPEPGWCLGHHEDDGYREDIAHEGPETRIEVPTSRGPELLLLTMLEQRPFTNRAPGTGVFRNVSIGDNDWFPSSPADLHTLAAHLSSAARAMHVFAEELEQMGGAR